MDYKKYEALDKSRQKLLCFCAFIGGNIEPQSLKEYAKISSVALTKVTSYVKELTNGSFLQSEGFDWRSHDYIYQITPAHYYRVLHFLFVSRAEWLVLFESLNIERSACFSTLYDGLKKSIRKEDINIPSFYFTGNMIPYFIPVGMEPDFTPLIRYE